MSPKSAHHISLFCKNKKNVSEDSCQSPEFFGLVFSTSYSMTVILGAKWDPKSQDELTIDAFQGLIKFPLNNDI